VTRVQELFDSFRAELPEPAFKPWPAIFFSLSVLTFLISLAAAQTFLAASGVCYAVQLVRRRSALSFPPIKLPLALFCIGTVLSVLWAANPAAGWFSVRKLVLFLILLLATNLIASGKHLEFLFQGLFLESAVAALVGAVQFIKQYRAAGALHPDHIYAFMTSERITGFMGHWMNFSGQQMLVFAGLMAYLLIRTQSKEEKGNGRGRTVFWWILLALIALSIVLGFTRGVWLGCFVGGVYLVARWKPRLLFAVPVLLLAVYLLAPSMVQQRLQHIAHPRSEPALSIRFEMWGVAWRMIQAHPWLGVGPNNVERQYVLYLPPGHVPELGYHAHFHSNFFQFGAERGLPVLGAWLWLMVALAISIWRIRSRLTCHRWVADAALAGWMAFIVEGFFEFNFGTSPVLMLFLFVMSVPFAAERIESKTEG